MLLIGVAALQSSLYPQFGLKNVPAGMFLEIERQHEALGLDIGPEMAITAWQGEMMDYDLNISGSAD